MTTEMRGAVVAIILTATAFSLGTRDATASRAISGPVVARVLSAIDGDTLRVRAHIWLGHELDILVRLDDIDAPEMNGACAAEKRRAAAARNLLRRLTGDEVRLYDIQNGKYAGRVVARVETTDGVDVSARLRKAGLVRPYDGGARQSWCGPDARAKLAE